MILKILLLVSSVNLGDVSQAEATLEAISAKISIEKIEIDSSKALQDARAEYLSKIENFPKNEKYITLAVGEKSMELFQYLLETGAIDNNRSYNCLSIHQYFDAFLKLNLLDHIIVPEATIDQIYEKEALEKFNNRTFIFAPLSDNPTELELKISYENWIDPQKPSLNDKYIIVMLPGDAPDATNKMRYFTKESADELYKDVYKLWGDLGKTHKIIIQNGPRTGKFDPQTGKLIGKHEYIKRQDYRFCEILSKKLASSLASCFSSATGDLLKKAKLMISPIFSVFNASVRDDTRQEIESFTDPKAAIDNISAYFISLFKDIEYQFFNFAFEIDGENKKIISFFNPLLYLAQQNENIFILPGGSVSMMGQIPLYLPSNRIILFKSSSMNEDHEAVFRLAFQRNYLSYFSKTGEVIAPKTTGHREESDAEKIAKDVVLGYSQKFPYSMAIE